MIKKNSKSVIRSKSCINKPRPLSYASAELMAIQEVPTKKISRRSSMKMLKDFFSLKKNCNQIKEEKGQKVFRRKLSIQSIEFWEA
jgi:hypothetical protein